MRQLFHLKSLVNAIIMYDKKENTKTNIGFDCKHQSVYSLNDKSKQWFEAKIRRSVQRNLYVPEVTTDQPDGMKDTLISTLNFQNYLIFLIMNNADAIDKQRIHQFSVFELMSLMHKSLSRKLDIDDLKKFIEFKEAYDCVGCETNNLCFPKHSFDIQLK